MFELLARLPYQAKLQSQMYYCAFIGSFGENACNPRTLSSLHLNHMVSLEGIVTKCSLVRPKVVKSVHYNEKKNIFHFREYRDQTMTASGAASTSVYPQEDEDGNPVSFSGLKFNKYKLKPPLASHRVRLLYLPRSSNDINSGDARTCACRTVAAWRGCNHG